MIQINIQKSNLYENENKVNCSHKDMDCDLSIYHTISLFIWANTIGAAIVSKNAIVNPFVSSLDCICWSTFRRLNHPFDFISK